MDHNQGLTMQQHAHRCAVPAHAQVFASLPGHHYQDAFKIALADNDARDLAQLLAARGTGRPERWLARLRDMVVAPFGLKPIGQPAMAPFEHLALSTAEAIYAVDDRHVDVRIAYRTETTGTQRQLIATTLVRVHHALGWVYLVGILPFHFYIVKRQLERIKGDVSCSHV
jgi:hypothetical protein